jgi:N-methylhydantoinase A
VGQGHEIPVALPVRALTEDDVDALRQAFDHDYARFYDRPVPGSDVEIMSYAVTVTTVPDVVAPPGAPAARPSAPRSQPVWDTASGVVGEWAVLDRASLAEGQSVAGPAIIAEDETSTLIGPGWTATVDERGYLDLRRSAA